MVAKLIVHGEDRDRAIAKMSRALGELVIEGIKTNVKHQQWMLNNAVFRSGNFGTAYYASIEKELEHVK